MTAARRQAERAAWSDAEEPPVGVEQVEEREEVVLVRSAAVEKDERALRLAGGLAPASDELAHARGARGSGSGVSVCSTWERRCSNAGGRMSASPRCCGSSSIAESRAESRQLEEDAARLAEVHGLEPEAVDDRSRAHAGLGDAALPVRVIVVVRRPRDVVHRPGAGDPGACGRLVVAVEAAARRAAHLPCILAGGHEAHDVLEQLAARLRA